MSLRVVHSGDAERDLDAIVYLISHDSPDAAFRWLDEIDRTMRLIAFHPGVDEAVDHLQRGVRRISNGAYVLYFKPHKDRVELVRVIHGSRLIKHLGP